MESVTNENQISSILGDHLQGYENDSVIHIFTPANSIVPIIPKAICVQFKNIEVFHISNSKLERVTENSFFNCKKLKEIDVRKNILQSLTALSFLECDQMVVIKLSENKISDINRDAFARCANLKELHLNQNKLTTLHQNTFRSLKNLRYLSLNDNYFESLPSNLFESLTSLIFLYLNYNRIKLIDENHFKSLINLESLLLQGNKLTEVPFRSFQTLINITYLDIAENQLELLHSRSFGVLENLKDFSIAWNKIEAIDRRVFKKMPKLRQILATSNKCINRNFINFESVESNVMPYIQNCIDMYSELFPTPKEFCKYFTDETYGYTCELRNVTFNEDTDVPLILGDHLIGRGDIAVENVVVLASSLTKVPPTFFTTFPNLRSLSIRNVGLEIIDETTFEECGAIKILDISDNRIRILPGNSFYGCTRLQTILINNNVVQRMESCGSLFTKLKELKQLSMKLNLCINDELNEEELNSLRSNSRYGKLHQCFSGWFQP